MKTPQEIEVVPEELDAEMHVLLGWMYDSARHTWHRNGYLTAYPDTYTVDRAAAFAVLEKCVVRTEVSLRMDGAVYQVFGSNSKRPVEAQTLPLAICLFAKHLFAL